MIQQPLLFHRFPELAPHFPWVPLLTSVPTPVMHVPELGLWVKRDDLACTRYGGNKARKFEWILGALKAKGKLSFVTFGGLCSNHCTAAAIYGRSAGMDVSLCFLPTPLTESEYEELLLQASLRVHQAMLFPGGLRYLDLPIVPPAGSSVGGILGYVNAGLELAVQVEQGDLPNPERIYIAAATRGTALGLAMGLALAELKPCPQVIAVETVTPAWQRARVFLPTPQRALQRLRTISPEARRRLPENINGLACEARLGFDQEALGTVAPIVQLALEEAAKLGLLLDPHFSARAWAAMMVEQESWQGKETLFWHTHGQAPPLSVGGIQLPPDVERAARRGLGQT